MILKKGSSKVLALLLQPCSLILLFVFGAYHLKTTTTEVVGGVMNATTTTRRNAITTTASKNTTIQDRTCVWNETLNDCYGLLSQQIFGDAKNEHLYYHHQGGDDLQKQQQSNWVTKWYFLGDSTMYCLFTALLNHGFPHNIKKWTKFRWKFYDFKPNRTQVVPPMGWEGPFKPIKPFRMESGSFSNVWFEMPMATATSSSRNATATGSAIGSSNISNPSATTVQAEWLGVEYALDVELPSKHGRTTQQTTSWYIQEQEKSGNQTRGRTACVVATGHHDLQKEDLPAEQYAKHVDIYRKLITRACGYQHYHSSNDTVGGDDTDPPPPPLLIWLGMTGSTDHPGHAQFNTRIDAFNKAVLATLPHDWVFMDVYPKSLVTRHADNIHMDAETFYWPLANMFWKLAIGGTFQDLSGKNDFLSPVRKAQARSI